MISAREELIEKLAWRKPKEHFVEMCSRPEFLPFLAEICLSDDPKLNWRAAWVLSSIDASQLKKIFPKAQPLINTLQRKEKDGYKREIIKLIMLLDLDEDEEGAFYDAALNIWEDLALASAARLYALRGMLHIAKLYPELNHEIAAYNDDHYLQGVSPGIQSQMRKIFKDLS